MYTTVNFKTKKQLKDAVKNWNEHLKAIADPIFALNVGPEVAECSLASKSGQSLGDCREGQVAKILKTPDAFIAAFDALPDPVGDGAQTGLRQIELCHALSVCIRG
jgi:hypothetical protein